MSEQENSISTFIHEDIILLGVDATDREDAIRKLGKVMFDKGYVKDTYVDAVLLREKSFPTGLPTEEVKVAIPHTDTTHVNQAAIGVAVLNEPVEFFELATLDVPVAVEIIFLLAIFNPKEQVLWLQRLITLFQTERFLTTLKNSKSPQELYEVLVKELERVKAEE